MNRCTKYALIKTAEDILYWVVFIEGVIIGLILLIILNIPKPPDIVQNIAYYIAAVLLIVFISAIVHDHYQNYKVNCKRYNE